jgi:hypothetical protein
VQQDLPTLPPAEYVGAVRAELMRSLPGFSAARVEIDDDTEQTVLDALADGDGTTQRQAIDDAREMLLEMLRAHGIDDDTDHALVVYTELMRQLARALLVADYPRLYVFNRIELALAEQPEPVVSG